MTDPRTAAALSATGIAPAVLTDLDLDSVMDRVLGSARELTGARYAALGVLDETRTTLERFITSGLTERERRAIGPAPKGRGLLGEVIRRSAPLRTDDVQHHPQSYGFPLGHPPMHTFLGVPIVVSGRPFGNLYVTEKEGGESFTDEDEQALVALAELAGVAVAHARRQAALEASERDLRQRVGALEAKDEITRALAGETDIDTILELVAKRGRALVSARALLVERRLGDDVVVAATAGDPPDGVGGRGADSDMAVPMTFRGVHYGVLVAIERTAGGPAFGAGDRLLLEAFASAAAAALATAHAAAGDQPRSARSALRITARSMTS